MLPEIDAVSLQKWDTLRLSWGSSEEDPLSTTTTHQ